MSALWLHLQLSHLRVVAGDPEFSLFHFPGVYVPPGTGIGPGAGTGPGTGFFPGNNASNDPVEFKQHRPRS